MAVENTKQEEEKQKVEEAVEEKQPEVKSKKYEAILVGEGCLQIDIALAEDDTTVTELLNKHSIQLGELNLLTKDNSSIIKELLANESAQSCQSDRTYLLS